VSYTAVCIQYKNCIRFTTTGQDVVTTSVMCLSGQIIAKFAYFTVTWTLKHIMNRATDGNHKILQNIINYYELLPKHRSLQHSEDPSHVSAGLFLHDCIALHVCVSNIHCMCIVHCAAKQLNKAHTVQAYNSDDKLQ